MHQKRRWLKIKIKNYCLLINLLCIYYIFYTILHLIFLLYIVFVYFLIFKFRNLCHPAKTLFFTDNSLKFCQIL